MLRANGQSASLPWYQAPIFIFIAVRQWRVCRSGAPTLTRGRVCRLQLLLAVASAVILGSESGKAHNHILLPQFRDSPKPGGPGPRIYLPQE
jgi:hypothetical protein